MVSVLHVYTTHWHKSRYDLVLPSETLFAGLAKCPISAVELRPLLSILYLSYIFTTRNG